MTRKEKRYWRVIGYPPMQRLGFYLEHGYETERDYRHQLFVLCDRWRGRVGEQIDERNSEGLPHSQRLVRLSFGDTPGGRPDTAWLPAVLLTEISPPAWAIPKPEPDPIEQLLDEIFGFDD